MDYRIIVIDDEIDFLDSIRRGLMIAGYKNFHLNADPVDALSLIKNGEHFDIALIDITMPQMDGIELLEKIRQISPDTMCVMVSALSDAEFAVKCMQKGAYDYLVKPISKDTLLLSINRMINVHEQVINRKLSEKALKESEELHRITLSNITDAVFITDNKGEFTFICPNVDFIFKLSDDKVLSMGNITRLLGDAPLNHFMDNHCNEIKNLECEVNDIDGDAHHLLINVKKVSIKGGTILFTCRDVTEYYNMLKLQQEKDEIFRQLTEHINIVFWVTSIDHKRIIFVSPAFEKIWGYRCEDLYETPGLRLNTIHKNDRQSMRDAMEVIGENIENGLDEKYRIIRPDGSQRLIRDRAFPVKDENGRVYRIVGMAQDITDLE